MSVGALRGGYEVVGWYGVDEVVGCEMRFPLSRDRGGAAGASGESWFARHASAGLFDFGQRYLRGRIYRK